MWTEGTKILILRLWHLHFLLQFIQGKIYVQTGKALRPAVVSFLTNPEKDHTERLAAALKKRSETSPTKQVTSPHKEHSHDEVH